MSERFFLAAPPAAGRAVLAAEEARHLSRVLRGKVGDEIAVFAGTGCAWPARIVRIGRDEVELETGEPRADPPLPSPPLTLAVALPKGERQKWLVEKLTELGVARLVPLVTARGVAEATASARARLQRGVIEACKQCGRNTLMAIEEPGTIAELLRGSEPDVRGVIADPQGPPLDVAALKTAAAGILVLIGPEGGFTEEELALATAAGAIRAGLAPHVLRVETAAIAAAARLV